MKTYTNGTKQAQATSARRRTQIGMNVRHKYWGNGVITEAWGSWRACSNCFTPVDKENCPKCREGFTARREGYSELPPPIRVTAFGVYEVRFFKDGKIRPINKCWLEEIRT